MPCLILSIDGRDYVAANKDVCDLTQRFRTNPSQCVVRSVTSLRFTLPGFVRDRDGQWPRLAGLQSPWAAWCGRGTCVWAGIRWTEDSEGGRVTRVTVWLSVSSQYIMRRSGRGPAAGRHCRKQRRGRVAASRALRHGQSGQRVGAAGGGGGWWRRRRRRRPAPGGASAGVTCGGVCRPARSSQRQPVGPPELPELRADAAPAEDRVEWRYTGGVERRRAGQVSEESADRPPSARRQLGLEGRLARLLGEPLRPGCWLTCLHNAKMIRLIYLHHRLTALSGWLTYSVVLLKSNCWSCSENLHSRYVQVITEKWGILRRCNLK